MLLPSSFFDLSMAVSQAAELNRRVSEQTGWTCFDAFEI